MVLTTHASTKTGVDADVEDGGYGDWQAELKHEYDETVDLTETL